MIDKFEGEYAFLSNFYICPVHWETNDYTNAEAAFWSGKLSKPKSRKVFTNMAPRSSRLKGKGIKKIRFDWEKKKDLIMYQIVKDKFNRNEDLKEKLLATGNEELINNNLIHDNEYGNCLCEKCKDIEGQNKLGKILMKVRTEIREKEEKKKLKEQERQLENSLENNLENNNEVNNNAE